MEKNGIEYVRTTIRFIGPAGQNKRKLEGEKELWKYSTVLMLNQKKSFASEISKIHISQIEGAQRGTGTTLLYSILCIGIYSIIYDVYSTL